MPAYKPVPHELTDPIPAPPAPLLSCALPDGTPAICVTDALATIPAWEAALERANADRARVGVLGKTDGQ